MNCKGCRYYKEARYTGSFKIYRLCHYGGKTEVLKMNDACRKEEMSKFVQEHKAKKQKERNGAYRGIIHDLEHL